MNLRDESTDYGMRLRAVTKHLRECGVELAPVYNAHSDLNKAERGSTMPRTTLVEFLIKRFPVEMAKWRILGGK